VIFRDHCRRLCRERYPDEPEEHLYAASDRISEWCRANRRATLAEAKAAMEADGSLVVSLTVLLICVELLYNGIRLWRLRHGEAGDEECDE